MDTEGKLQQRADELGDGAEEQTDTPEQRRRMTSDQEAAIHDLQENDQHNAAHDAAMIGDIECLKTLLDLGIDPMYRTSTQETLLHIAARWKHPETLQYLCIRYPEMIQLTDNNQWNAAHCAAMGGDIDCLKTLIDQGIDPMYRTSTQETLLHIAARWKHPETLKYLCMRYPEMIQLTDNNQWNAAHYAAMGGDIDCLKTLIDQGIDPLSRTSTQETLLHIAARWKHPETLQYLCMIYPELIQLTDNNQWNAAHYAAMGGDIDCLKTLIDHSIDPMSRTSTQETLLHIAARWKHPETLQYLCMIYPELIQLTDKNQWNAAHYAVMGGDIDCLKTLIDHGIDPMSRTSTHETMLHIAARCKHPETLQYLCKRFPLLIQLTDKNQWNAAHYAAMDGNIDCLKTLIKLGIDPLSSTSTQETLLHVAARFKHPETLEYLCKKYPLLIKLTDKNQWNAAHYAAMDGNIECLKTIIDHGIDPMSRTSTHETMLHIAARCKHPETLQYLCKRYPLLIQLTDKNQWIAAHYASMDGNIDCLKTLIKLGIDPLSSTSTQETLLHVAARFKHPETLEYLCKKYPRMIKLTDKNLWNAAHYAAMHGYIDCLKTLIDQGIDPMSRTSTHETLLHIAARFKHRDTLVYLLFENPLLIQLTDKNQWNAAHYAAMGGDIDCLKTLIDQGIDPMYGTSTQETLLHVAARWKNPETLEYLCKRYPELIQLTDNNQWNAAHCAAMGGDIDCLKTLIDQGIDPMYRTSTQETLLHIAARWKHPKTLQYLCMRYPELIQLTDKNQWNAAHYAAMGGDIDSLKTLIDQGIDPMYRTSTQETLLHIAARWKHPETLEYLCQRYPELIPLTDNNQWNAAHYAAMGGDIDCSKTFIDQWIDPMSRTSTQKTLLHIAAGLKHPETLQYLCKRYPLLIQLTDNNHWNAAHCAAMGGNIEGLKTLIDHGIDPLSRTSAQETLLHVAARWKHPETLQYLCKRYPELIQLTDKNEWNAAHYAAMGGDIDCLKTLILHGIDPLSSTSTHETVSYVAARYKHPEIVEHLSRTYGQLPDVMNSVGEVPGETVNSDENEFGRIRHEGYSGSAGNNEIPEDSEPRNTSEMCNKSDEVSVVSDAKPEPKSDFKVVPEPKSDFNVAPESTSLIKGSVAAWLPPSIQHESSPALVSPVEKSRSPVKKSRSPERQRESEKSKVSRSPEKMHVSRSPEKVSVSISPERSKQSRSRGRSKQSKSQGMSKELRSPGTSNQSRSSVRSRITDERADRHLNPSPLETISPDIAEQPSRQPNDRLGESQVDWNLLFDSNTNKKEEKEELLDTTGAAESLEEPRYQRKLARSSIAWSSYKNGEPKARSSLDLRLSTDQGQSRSRPGSASKYRGQTSADDERGEDGRTPRSNAVRRRPVSVPRPRNHGNRDAGSQDTEVSSPERPGTSQKTRPESANRHALRKTKKKGKHPSHGDDVDISIGFDPKVEHRSRMLDWLQGGAKMKKQVDDTMDQYLVTSLQEHMNSVGALVHGDRGHGTVFRVGRKYVMTAKHVVSDIIDPWSSGREDVNLLKGNDVHVTFSGSLYQPGPFTYKIKEITYDNQYLDVAILEIENYHTTAFPPKIALCKCPLGQAVTELSLIGFGHPSSPKKQLDPRCRIKYQYDVYPAIEYLRTNRHLYKDQVVLYQGNTPYMVSSVDQLYNDFDNPDKLLWSCYMEGGGSGSPVINHFDHKSLKVVALYTHAIPGFLQFLHPLDKRNYPDNKRFEMGPRMSSIFRDLQQRNEQLANELFPGDC